MAAHQTALYDLLSAALLFGALLRQDRRWLGLTGSQWAVLTAIVVMTALIARDRPWRRAPWAWAPPDFDLPWRYPATDGDEPARPESAVRVLPPGPPARTADPDDGESDRKDLTES